MARSRAFESGKRVFLTLALTVLCLITMAHAVRAQGGPPVSGLDLTPSNPLGMPGTTGGLPRGSDTLNLSSRMFPEILPAIPGLEISYLHSFGQGIDSSRLLLEFVRPFRMNATTTIYGEAHGLLHDFWRGDLWSEEGRLDLAIGGGIRTRLGSKTIVGAHAFYDATHERDQWRSSASVGGVMATILPGDDAVDFTLNWYGGSSSDPLIGLFQQAAKGSLDGTITYYHELWGGGPDLRLSAFGYSEDESVTTVHLRERGYGGRVALASRDGMLRASYQYERDSTLREVHTVGVNLNVGFRLENLLALQSPIEKPTPIFSSPRNLDRWQNVSEGTERHLVKMGWPPRRCDIHSNCKYCWQGVGSTFENFMWGRVGEPKFSEWKAYLSKHLHCAPGCAECIYFVHRGLNNYFYCECLNFANCWNTMCTAMDFKNAVNPFCCSTDGTR